MQDKPLSQFIYPGEIAEWQRLQAQGHTVAQVAKATGWQARTVKKHLEGEIRSGEARQIRRDLFKERLGEHWDLLIERVMGSLTSLNPPSPQEVSAMFGTSNGLDWRTKGFHVARGPSGTLLVEIMAR